MGGFVSGGFDWGVLSWGVLSWGVLSGSPYNLSSGVAVEDTLAVDILNLEKKGSELANKFKSERMLIGNNNKKLHDPLPRNKRNTFTDSVKTCVIKRDKVTTTVEISRNILGELLSFSAKGSKPIDFNVALTYPLSAIPLSIALPDGTRRKTPKSKLMEVKSATTEPSTPYEMFCLKENSPSQE